MYKNGLAVLFLLLLTSAGLCCAAAFAEDPANCQSEAADANKVDAILEQLNQETLKLVSYQSRIEYLFSQPLLDSQTLRVGDLYYQKTDSGSVLRINFKTLKQDDEQEQKYIDQYVFDGHWLTHIDYQLKEVKKHQLADTNEPVDAFEMAGRNFPLIGFTKTKELRKEFEIKLIETEQALPDDAIQLHLKVKTTSIYKDDYVYVDFWIDKKLTLPARIVAVSTEDDIYEIRLLNAGTNKKIDRKIFEVKVPEGFGEPEVIPLKRDVK